MELINPKRLRRLMAIQEVSPAQLAAAAGWGSRTSVTRLMSGQYATVKDVNKCARIAEYLGVDIGDLFAPTVSSVTRDSDERRSA